MPLMPLMPLMSDERRFGGSIPPIPGQMEFRLFFLTCHGSTASVEGITYLKPTAKGPEKRAVDSDNLPIHGRVCVFLWFGGESEASHFCGVFSRTKTRMPKHKF